MPAQNPQRLGFGRDSRIKQGRDFARLRKQGSRLAGGCLIANWRCLPPQAKSRLGVITSGRVGNAVVRSRARRLLREAFRLHQHEFTHPIELVLVARPSVVARTWSELERDFLTTLRKARLLK